MSCYGKIVHISDVVRVCFQYAHALLYLQKKFKKGTMTLCIQETRYTG